MFFFWNLEYYDNTPAMRARVFLSYVEARGPELRMALAKNITYDADIFEDAFSAAVVKVHDRILAGKVVASLKNYFFIAARNEYIQMDNKRKRNNAIREGTEAAEGCIDPSATPEIAMSALAGIRRRLWAVYPIPAVELFERYMAGGISYAKLGAETGRSPRSIADDIRAMRRFITTDKECIKIRSSYYDAYN